MTTIGARGCDQLARVGDRLGDDAGDRRGDRWRRRSPSRASAICASTPATRARAASISSRRAPARSRATPSCAARTRSRAAVRPLPRHVPSRHRIVALLARAGVRREQLLEALRRRPRRPRDRRRRRRRRPRADATCASAWRMSSGAAPACSSRSCASACARSARRAGERELGVGGVERRDRRRPSPRGRLRRPRRSRRRPPTCGATCTSVASTWPDTRTRSAGGGVVQAARRGRASATIEQATRATGSQDVSCHGACLRQRRGALNASCSERCRSAQEHVGRQR